MKDGTPNKFGLFGFRIYAPSIGYDNTGGVGLPQISYYFKKREKRVCKNTSDSIPVNSPTKPLNIINSTNNCNKETTFDCTGYTADQNCDLVWNRIGVIATRILQPDLNTVYITSNEIKRDLNKLLFIRWKAPTVPDTYHNIGISGNENMRYWSMSFISQVGLLGLYDFQTIIKKNGYVNLVISFGASRPSCVTTKNGFNWIDVSNLPLVPLRLFYRNNQVSQSFPYTAKNIPEGEIVPPEVMDDYYPCGKYVSPHYFNSCCCC